MTPRKGDLVRVTYEAVYDGPDAFTFGRRHLVYGVGEESAARFDMPCNATIEPIETDSAVKG